MLAALVILTPLRTLATLATLVILVKLTTLVTALGTEQRELRLGSTTFFRVFKVPGGSFNTLNNAEKWKR